MNTPEGYQTLLERITAVFTPQPDKPEETPETSLRALWLLAMGQHCSAEAAASINIRALDNQETRTLESLLGRLEAGEPLAHITNRQHFCGYEFIVNGQALIPRKETELLARAALAKITDLAVATPTVIDVCTGCGNLPIIFKHHHPNSAIYAADISPEAIALAKQNCDYHKLSNQIELLTGDLLKPLDAYDLKLKVDIITCNPPYISSKKVSTMSQSISDHEPALAFDGGPFGITILQRTLSESALYLKPGGWLLFEVGAGQGKSLIRMTEKSGLYSSTEAYLDENKEIRVIAAQKSTE